MKRAYVSVDNCAGCPHFSSDDGDHAPADHWGYQCMLLEKEVDPGSIDDDCPLEDE